MDNSVDKYFLKVIHILTTYYSHVFPQYKLLFFQNKIDLYTEKYAL